jgi:hypothetical protein
MDLDHLQYRSTTGIPSNHPFYKNWYVSEKAKDTYTVFTKESKDDKIKMDKCFEYPFLKKINNSINPGYRIQIINANGENLIYKPITYQDIQMFFNEVGQHKSVSQCSVADEVSSLVISYVLGTIQKLKVEVRNDLTVQVYCQPIDTVDQWKLSGNAFRISSRGEMKSAIANNYGQEIITDMERKNWFVKNLGPEISTEK